MAGDDGGGGGGGKTWLWGLAGWMTMFLAILDVILSLLLMLAHVCAIETDGRDDTENYTFLHYFYVDYLAKDDCEYANLINSQADIKPTPAWPVCDAGDLATVTTNPPHGYTDADATFIWVTIYLVLAIFWALSAVPLLLGSFSRKMTRTTVLTFPWIAMTSVMLIYGMMAAIVYMADLSIPIDYKDCDSSDFYSSDLQSKTVQAVMVLPMFFARGFLVWFALAAFLGAFVYMVVLRKPKAKQERLDDRTKGRTLNAYDGDVIPTTIDPPKKDPDPKKVVAASMVAAMASQAIQQATAEEDDGFDNDGFTDDEGGLPPVAAAAVTAAAVSQQFQQPPPQPHRQYPPAAQPSQLHIANQPPIIVPHPASQARQSYSPTMVPDREFVIPRARPDSLSGGYSDRRSTSGGGGGGKPLRTPSGREVSAQEYLYQDYRQASSRGRGYSRDDDYAGDRYFTRLKD